MSNADFNHVLEASQRYNSSISKKIRNEGKVTSARYFKSLHRRAHEIVLGHPHTEIPFCKIDKDGFPKELKALKGLILSNDNRLIRCGLTICRFYESIIVKPQWDKSVITEGPVPGYDKHLEKFSSFCHKWTQGLRINGIRPKRTDRVFGALKKGPNGPSIATAHYDARAVLSHYSLQSALYALSVNTGNSWIYRMMENNAKEVPDMGYETGKIALLQEGGGKTRVIAIGDYWSQNILRPIHDQIMNILRRMETDGTYSQGKQFERIQLLSSGKHTYCFDLSSATDRFPIAYQEEILKHVYGEHISGAWANVLTQRRFKSPDGYVKWGCGQPLGLMSSWAVFALTHHAIIEYCAYLEGLRPFRSYAVLGDDVVIWESKVAKRYQKVMNTLGVDINLGKSFVSEDGRYFEFAKRISKDSTELTGLKFNVLDKANTLMGWLDLDNVLKDRSFPQPQSRNLFPGCLSLKHSLYLDVLLWEKHSGLGGPYRVTTDFPELKIEDFKHKVKSYRFSLLQKKLEGLDKFLMSNKDIGSLFETWGILVPSSLLELGNGLIENVHPVVVDINQRGESMGDALNSIFMTDPDDLPEILPCEYLPLPYTSVYFGNKRDLIAKFRSQMVIEVYKQLNI